MSVAKYRFVSPGVFINEIDNSQLPRTPAEIGPVIIGQTLRGPMMRPVKVNSFSDFIEVFGSPLPGGQSGDIWREGNKLTTTYGAYAAQAYLRNSSPVTFIRLGGYQNDSQTSGDEAGWTTTKAYGLFASPINGSNVVSGSAPLVAVLYSNSDLTLTGLEVTSSTTQKLNAVNSWVRSVGTNMSIGINVDGVLKTVDFDENSKRYIRKVLNTVPSLLPPADFSGQTTSSYFLGETFETWAEQLLGDNAKNSPDIALNLIELKDFSKFNKEASFANNDIDTDTNLGWVVSQHVGSTGSFSADTNTGLYTGVQKLFKLVGLTEGSWNSKNIKISIEEIKESTNIFNQYGSFTVSVRSIDDSDTAPVYLERFPNVTLNPNAQNYIAKAIGDKYTTWDYTKKAFIEYGTYDNASKFIRVVMNDDVDNGLTEPTLLPFGFYGPEQYSNVTISGSSSNVAASSFLTGNLSSTCTYSSSFALPLLPLLTSSADAPVQSLSSIYWGLKTNYSDQKLFNKDIRDFVLEKPEFSTPPTKTSFMFSLDNVSASNTAAAYDESYRRTGVSLTALYPSSSLTDAILGTYNKFTMPLFGGFDGVDITKKDPFANQWIENKTETDSYAYNSIKVAIESVSDAEVVEMNLAAIPGLTERSLNSLLIEKCEARGDALAVIDLKGDYNPEKRASDRKPVVDDVIDAIDSYNLNSSYGCAFFPWVLALDTNNNAKVWLPPSVAALGTFSSSQRRTELWFAPAGFNRGGLSNGAAGLPIIQTALRLSSKDRDALYERNINPIASFPSEGIVIFGQKTLQVTPSALDRINVRRLMIYLKKEISRFATTILFDPNVQVTWNRFLNLTEPFLASVQSRFGLTEYRVILDETTTTPDLIDRNVVYAKILLKPARAIEFVALDFVISNTGASFAD